MQQERSGTIWCELCGEDIPDAFEDHYERHLATTTGPVTASGVFWLAALAVGFMGGIVGGVIAASVR